MLRPVLATLADELISVIAEEVPAYARPLEGTFGRGVRRGVDGALSRFLEIVELHGSAGRGLPRPETPGLAAGRDVYVTLGAGEVRAGRTLDTLLGAYRVGARVAWRRLAVAAMESGGLDAQGLVVLAEMMFAYIDEISAASAEGYAQAQSSAAGERERLRERLAELLLAGGEEELVREKARAAAYRLPDAVAAIAADATSERLFAQRLPGPVPATVRDDVAFAFVPYSPDPGWRAATERALAGLGDAVVGPGVPWTASAVSAERAQFARSARAGGRIPAGGAPPGAGAESGSGSDDPLFTDDHSVALILARDPELVAALAARRLAPLATLPARARPRLAETLLQWLALSGQRGKIAEVLHVHPQTVRYRLNQLRTLFGPDLDDPLVRFELELVLRAGHA